MPPCDTKISASTTPRSVSVMASRRPANTVVTMCGKITWRTCCMRVAHAGDGVDDHREDAMAEAERDLDGRPDSEDQHEQRQQNRLRDAVQQQHDRVEAAAADIAEPDQN